jgi:cysteine synthase B
MELVEIVEPALLAQPVAGLAAAVGNTPLLPLRRIAELPMHVELFAKAEWFNPGGSVKDRPALNILQTALADGRLTPGKRLLDSTSGNMGIAYATFGAAMDIPVTLVIPSNASPERLEILRALGAELVLTDPTEGSDGAIRTARRMAAEQPERYFYADQYSNPANWQAHYLTTGPEIAHQTGGRVTHFVAGLGTSGTLTGVSRYLRAYNPQIQIIAVQPDAAFHGLEGLKHMATAMVRRLARREGLFVGISSGAAAVAALRVAAELREGLIVTVFPDAGYKYLSDQALWSGEAPLSAGSQA